MSQNSLQLPFKAILLNNSDGVHFVPIDEIVFCVSDNAYTTFQLTNSKKLIISKGIGLYEQILTRYGFLRVHQSYLVNIIHIYMIEKTDLGFVIKTKTGLEVKMASQKRPHILSMLKKWSI